MPKVKFTKNELKKQRDALKRFNRYLPTLKLKQQQLQVVLRDIERSLNDVQGRVHAFKEGIREWVAVFSHDFHFTDYVRIVEIPRVYINIAGTDIPKFEEPVFEQVEYGLFQTSAWVDAGIEALKKDISLQIELATIQEQHSRISHELSITIQRVNLFEKVRIPESKENIRNIQIYLGDQQTAAIVRGKLAKAGLA